MNAAEPTSVSWLAWTRICRGEHEAGEIHVLTPTKLGPAGDTATSGALSGHESPLSRERAVRSAAFTPLR